MKLYTKQGDSGETRLYDGTKVAKWSSIFEVLGELDNLNVTLGTLLPQLKMNAPTIEQIMHNIFTLSSYIASPKKRVDELPESVVTDLEQLIDTIDAKLPKLTQFILPTGSPSASLFHRARVEVRRAERHYWGVIQEPWYEYDDPQLKLIGRYLNRLSDFFFVCARHVNHSEGIPDIPRKFPVKTKNESEESD